VTFEDRRFPPEKMQALMSEERHARWNPAGLLARLKIPPGASVLDLGCGPGFWTFPLAEAVGAKGRVWALDTSQEMLDELKRRNPPEQVRTLRCELPKIDLLDHSLDWIWGAFVLHEVDPPEELAREMLKTLKPGGALALLDWRPDGLGESGPPRHHRLPVEQVVKVFSEAGFHSVAQTWQDDDGYLVEART
jgi:ubiquinone/menaquinone biosynthesis C-methylase UbiE